MTNYSNASRSLAVLISVIVGINPTVALSITKTWATQEIKQPIEQLVETVRRLEAQVNSLEKQHEMTSSILQKILENTTELQSLKDDIDAAEQAVSQKVTELQGDLKTQFEDAVGMIDVNCVKSMTKTTSKAEVEACLSTLEGAGVQARDILQRAKGAFDEALADATTGCAPEIIANLTASSVSAGDGLPPCVNDSEQLRDVAKRYEQAAAASEEMATMMSAMMTTALASGNPYVIFAVVALSIIMSALSSGGGEGGGKDGDGSSNVAGTGGGSNDSSPGAGSGASPVADSGPNFPGGDVTTTGNWPSYTFSNGSNDLNINMSQVESEISGLTPLDPSRLSFVAVDFGTSEIEVRYPHPHHGGAMWDMKLEKDGSVWLLEPTGEFEAE